MPSARPPDPGQACAAFSGRRVTGPSKMSSTTSILVLFSLGVFLLHMLVNSRYGFHRDELLTINNARSLVWGT